MELLGPLPLSFGALRHRARRDPDGSGAAGVDAVIGVWVELWREYPDGMRVMQHARTLPLGELGDLHGAMMGRLLPLFVVAAREGALRTDDPALSARILARVAVPLLELCGEGPDGFARFRTSMHGLLLRS